MYWLWRLCSSVSFAIPLVGSLVGTALLLLTKVNYGLLLAGVIPGFGLGIFLKQGWKRPAILLGGIVILLATAAACRVVDLPGYMRLHESKC